MLTGRGLIILLCLAFCLGVWFGIWQFGKWTVHEIGKYRTQWEEINKLYDHRNLSVGIDDNGNIAWGYEYAGD